MYTWNGMKKLTCVEALEINACEGLKGYYLLYPDNTESLIEEECLPENILDLYDRDIYIGIERRGKL